MEPLMGIEMPLVFVLADMECWGICVDTGTHRKLERQMERRMEEVRALIWQNRVMA